MDRLAIFISGHARAGADRAAVKETVVHMLYAFQLCFYFALLVRLITTSWGIINLVSSAILSLVFYRVSAILYTAYRCRTGLSPDAAETEFREIICALFAHVERTYIR